MEQKTKCIIKDMAKSIGIDAFIIGASLAIVAAIFAGIIGGVYLLTNAAMVFTYMAPIAAFIFRPEVGHTVLIALCIGVIGYYVHARYVLGIKSVWSLYDPTLPGIIAVLMFVVTGGCIALIVVNAVLPSDSATVLIVSSTLFAVYKAIGVLYIGMLWIEYGLYRYAVSVERCT